MLSACDHRANPITAPSQPQADVAASSRVTSVSEIKLDIPDRSYHLDQANRAKVGAGFDVTALERLLQSVNPEYRDAMLRAFQPTGVGSGGVSMIADDELQRLLEAVWAPRVRQLPDEVLEHESAIRRYPGAAAERAARRFKASARKVDHE